MSKLHRTLKCKYYYIKFKLGKILCYFLGHKKEFGYNITQDKCILICICPRCSKILMKNITPLA